MTTSAIAVSEGSGKNVWTDERIVSAVAREAQYVLSAEPALPTYGVCNSASISFATTADHLIQIMAGASNYVRVNRVIVSQVGAAGAATSTAIYLVRLTTAGTGGTSLTPRPYDSGDAAAGATAMTLPTVKGTEGVYLFGRSIALSATYGTGYWEWIPLERCKPIIIPPGTDNGLAVRLGTGVASATGFVTVIFTETAWL